MCVFGFLERHRYRKYSASVRVKLSGCCGGVWKWRVVFQAACQETPQSFSDVLSRLGDKNKGALDEYWLPTCM